MNKSLSLIVLMCLVLPMVNAELFRTDINISIDDGNVTVHTESGDLGPLAYGCSHSDFSNDDDYSIYIDRDSFDEDSGVGNLTRTLIQVNRELADRCSTNLSQEYINCVEGRAIAAEVHENCREDRDQYKSEVGYYKNLSNSAANNASSWEERSSSCQSQLSQKNNDLNACEEENEDLSGKPLLWGIVGIALGVVGTNMFAKQKQARSSEEEQFGGY